MNDQAWMARTLQLAELGLYSTHPNPRVGCVIVKDGQLVGSGWHQLAGQPHAEVHALREAGVQARGATAYVTLEPCSHHGRTGPCAEALVQAGVGRVVVAMPDPNPQVARRGLALLRSAGIDVQMHEGELQQQARELNRGFIKRMQHGLPWVTAKLAMSLDGRTAMASGESQWITGPAARADVQLLRARSSVVISGADTVIHDDARLNVRAELLRLPEEQKELALRRQPLRLVVDSRGRVPVDSAFYRAGPALVASHVQPDGLPPRAAWLQVAANGGRVDLADLLRQLAQQHQANEVLVEAGPQLAGAFLRAGLLDELVIYMAGKLMGSSARPLFELPLAQMADSIELQIRQVRAVGCDWRMDCRIPDDMTPGRG